MEPLTRNPLCRAFSMEGSREDGILLLHGFTATPGTMRPLGEALHRDTGFTVYAPLLPGHGLTPEEMAKTRWYDWFRASQQAFDKPFPPVPPCERGRSAHCARFPFCWRRQDLCGVWPPLPQRFPFTTRSFPSRMPCGR